MHSFLTDLTYLPKNMQKQRVTVTRIKDTGNGKKTASHLDLESLQLADDCILTSS